MNHHLPPPVAEPILDVENLVVRFETPRGPVHAVDGVSFSVAPGETLGIVGESGCGKSTLGQAVLGLVEPSAGAVRLYGKNLVGRSRRSLRSARRDMQIVFQDPFASLDPRWRVGDLIAEPLKVHGLAGGRERRERVADLLARVGLPSEAAGRYPHQFSGGQRQRIGIARALALEPKLVVLDEPVSALDLSVQAQILNLLADLQETLGLSLVFISHDLSVVEFISHRVAVMYLGQIVEIGARDDIWREPAHPYTCALLDAVPRVEQGAAGPRRPVLGGDLPSPYAPPAGCRFHTRCPVAVDRCRSTPPKLQSLGGGHEAACHLVTPAY